MYIDFHTHIFPEKVASKALPKLSGIVDILPSTDGTASGLASSMEKAGVDISITLPTVTDPRQFDSILRFAAGINETWDTGASPRLISFAGIHPDCPDLGDKLTQIKNLGFRGVKIHPDYQEVCFHDIRYKRILYKTTELGLVCITHTGNDPYSPDKVHCTPEMILDVLKDVAPEKLVLAHMGSNAYYDQSEALLMGQNVYLDTAFSIKHMQPDQLVRMARKHGVNKVLFGTDCPWTSQKEDVEILNSLPFTQEEQEQIAWKNAWELLGL